MKPGYRTSEFWFTLVSFIFSGLYLTGLINDNNQKEELIANVSHAVESCILIGGQFIIFYKYITSRKQQKIEYEKTKQLEESKAIEVIKKEKENNNGDTKSSRKSSNTSKKRRSGKTRSRKTNTNNKRKLG
jgi:hypothetical protein